MFNFKGVENHYFDKWFVYEKKILITWWNDFKFINKQKKNLR
jgi:hypothetical protein